MRIVNAAATAAVLAASVFGSVVLVSTCATDAQCGVSEVCGSAGECVACEKYAGVESLANTTRHHQCNCTSHAMCLTQRSDNLFSFCSRRSLTEFVSGGICRTCDECDSAESNTFDGSACPDVCACSTSQRFCNGTVVAAATNPSRTVVGFCQNASTVTAESLKCSPCRDGTENQCTDATAAMPSRNCSDDCAAVIECSANHTECVGSFSGPVCTTAQQCKPCQRCTRFVAAMANGTLATSPSPMAGEAFDANCPSGGTCCAWTEGLRPGNGADAVTFHSTCDVNNSVIVEGLYLVHPRSDAVPPVLSVMEERMFKCENTKLNVSGQPFPVWRVHCPRIDRECLDTDYSFAVVRTDVLSGNKTVLVWPQKGSNYYEGTNDDKCLNRRYLLAILIVVIVVAAACVFVGVGMIFEKWRYCKSISELQAKRLEAEKQKEQEKAAAKKKKDTEPFFG